MPFYRCAGHVLQGKCEGGSPTSIPQSELDSFVLDGLAEQIMTPDRIMEVAAELYAKVRVDRESAGDRVKALRRQLLATKSKGKRLWEVASELGLEAMDGFKEQQTDIQERIDQLTRQIAAQEALLRESAREISREDAERLSSEMKE